MSSSDNKAKVVGYIVPMGKGLDSFVYREIEHLTSMGLRIVLFSTKFKKHDIFSPKPEWPYYVLSPMLLMLVFPWIAIRALFMPRLLWHAVRHKALVDLAFALHYSPRMRRENVEKIHCHFGDHKLFIGYYCKRLTGLPLSVTIHSHELHVNPNEAMFRVAIHACDQIFAISQLAVGILTDRYGVPAERVMLSRLSIDTEIWQHQRPIRVVTVGRFQPQKGFDDLFAAAKLLKDENIEFVVVGFGPLDVRGLAKAAGVEHKVVFFDKLGQAQLQLMYQSCDMYCLPSITHPEQGKEGVPVVLMEAMACGLPVVATRCGAVDEIVENILVDERSPEQLAQAIKRLALDPELRREHGQRNRKIVEEKYSSANVERFAQNLLSLDKVNK